MNRSARFRINAPRVIHEPFEHEVIVVNLDTGRYYCLQRTGVDLWDGLIAGASVQELVDGLSALYGEALSVVTPAVESAIDELAREELIVDVPSLDAPDTPWQPRTGARSAFERPALQTYTDMQDLLLLDPIHEVDDAGWPVPADPAKKGPASGQQ
jgi:hypothetical protein